jgi:hypothetical protein
MNLSHIIKLTKAEKQERLVELNLERDMLLLHMSDMDSIRKGHLGLSDRQIEILNYMIYKQNCNNVAVSQIDIANYLECSAEWIDKDITTLLRLCLIEPKNVKWLGVRYTINKEALNE